MSEEMFLCHSQTGELESSEEFRITLHSESAEVHHSDILKVCRIGEAPNHIKLLICNHYVDFVKITALKT